VHLTSLSLTNFRNYRALSLELPSGVSVFHGLNAQGKSNLLEAVEVLSTGRSSRAGVEREMVHWEALREELPFARLEVQVKRKRGNLRIEVVMQLTPRQGPPDEGMSPGQVPAPSTTQKRIRLNGAAKRLSDLVGQMATVLFNAESIQIVAGSPSDRRRYLDTLLSQSSRSYFNDLAQYTRVLAQRNHLLRRIQEGQSAVEELSYWDQELVAAGAAITLQRRECLLGLAPLAQTVHASLTTREEQLEAQYMPSLQEGCESEATRLRLEAEFLRRLQAEQRREVAAGMTLVGPHRDDLRFLVNGTDVSVYGSRGQHRTVTLALKLAEATFLEQEKGEPPILLLDDILAELDAARRRQLLQAVLEHPQAFITAAELDLFAQEFLSKASLFRIWQGRVEEMKRGTFPP
jgi:DNA replication and repair protein RecF